MITIKSFLSEFFSKFFIPAAPKLIPPSFVVDIGPTTGNKTLYGAGEFTKYIDPYILIWKLNLPGKPTPSMSLVGNKIQKSGTFSEVFGMLSYDLNNLRLSQEQIELFLKTYPDKLRIGGSTLMLFTKEDEPVYEDLSNLFVATLFIQDQDEVPQLQLEISMYMNNIVWDAEEHQTVTPQQ